MHIVFVLTEALLVVVLAAATLAILDVIGSVILLVWGPAMLVLSGAGTLGGLALIVWAIRYDHGWLGVGGVLGGLFFAWIFVQERQLASMRLLGKPRPT